MKGFGKFISKNRVLVLIVSILLLFPSLYGMISTKINYDLLTYLPKDLDSTQGQIILDEDFSSAATAMLIIEDMESKDVIKIKDKISNIDGVEKVTWVDDIVDTTIPKEMLPEDIKTTFYSDKSTLVLIKFKEPVSSKLTQDSVDEIRSVMNKQCFLSGTSALAKDTKNLADKQTPFYVLIAVLLCFIVLSLAMESVFIPFIFLASIGMAILYNFGTNIIFGQISYVTNALAAVLQLGVTMDYSIFLFHRYEEEKQKTDDKNEAMSIAIANTFSAISGSSLTTIAGFIALCVMKLGIGKDIGLVMAKGVFFGVVSTITVLPAMLLVMDGPIHKYQHRSLLPSFNKTAEIVTSKYKLFIVLFLIAFIPALYGQNNAQVYYNLDESLPRDMASVAALDKLKEEYNMTTTHMVIVHDSVPQYQIKEMVDKIEKVDGIEKVISYEKFVGPGVPESFVPEKVKEEFMANDYRLVLVNSKYKAATDEMDDQINEMVSIVKSYDKKGIVAGEGALTKDLIEIADIDFKNVNIASIIAIFAIILFLFASISVPVILVLSIELAIFINMAVPFYTNTSIPFIASIVIGTIQLGATVDYAILLTTRFREEMRNGHEKFEAMRISVQGSARSIVTSALAFFAATIGVRIVSNIDMIRVLCGMLARGALISMVVILFILPSVLLVSEKIIAATSLKWRGRPNLGMNLAKERN